MSGSNGKGTRVGRLHIIGRLTDAYRDILTPEAADFVADLTATFRDRVVELLERRQALQARYDAGERPGFMEETREIRESDWTVAPLPDDLQDRRVEITGPVSRKLVINALQYTPDGGEIVIRAEDVGGKLKVTVIDNGIGMTEEEKARVGELFWRGESEHVRSFKGHGLGLPICIGLIKALGGEFFYESKFGEGSSFGFVVPGMS